MGKTKVRACAFDLGGVLMAYTPERRLQALAEQTGLAPADVRRRLFDSGFSRGLDEGRIKARNVLAEAEKLLGKRLGKAVLERCWAQAFQPVDSVIALAASLRPQIATAVISNNGELTRRALQSAYPGVLDGFRPVLFSCDVGSCKPEPAIFTSLATLLDLEPAEVLLIDDSTVNVTMADSLGFQTHHFTSARALAAHLTANT